ncbi:MAG: CorA family divalent cation transporter [Anaeromyxobacter sp.]
MHAIEFDFAIKQEQPIDPKEIQKACEAGRFCWVDIDREDESEAVKAMIAELQIAPDLADEITGPDIDGRHDVYDDALHFTLTSLLFVDGQLNSFFVDIVVGERYLMSIHTGKVEFIDRVRRIYRRDFLRFARSGGFLLYEYWDQLIHGYRKTFRAWTARAARCRKAF